MVGDQHGGADDVADADDDFEAAVHALAPALLGRPGAGEKGSASFISCHKNNVFKDKNKAKTDYPEK